MARAYLKAEFAATASASATSMAKVNLSMASTDEASTIGVSA